MRFTKNFYEYDMKQNTNIYLVIKVLLVGLIITALVYLFHPAAGQFSIFINGDPVTNPIIQLAVFPSLFVVLFFTGILAILAFFGVGLFVFLSVLMFVLLGIFIFAPYTWPVLAIIFTTIIVMSLGNNKSTK